MSLVMAFSGNTSAVIAGDQREILFRGQASCIALLESELYSNKLCTEEQLHARAAELDVSITIKDDKCKVWEQDGILIGEVTETDGPVIRRRRICISCGRYAIFEKSGESRSLLSRGEGSHFLVLGNEATKGIAHRCIREHWKPGGGMLRDAIKVLILSMQEAARRTASVSRTFSILQTRKKADVCGTPGL